MQKSILVVPKDLFETLFSVIEEGKLKQAYRIRLEDLIGTSIRLLNNTWLLPNLGIKLETKFKIEYSSIDTTEYLISVIDLEDNKGVNLALLIKQLNYYAKTTESDPEPIKLYTKVEYKNLTY